MIAFATAEDALDGLYRTAMTIPYTVAPEDVDANEYNNAARDRVLSELSRLRAYNLKLKATLLDVARIALAGEEEGGR